MTSWAADGWAALGAAGWLVDELARAYPWPLVAVVFVAAVAWRSRR